MCTRTWKVFAEPVIFCMHAVWVLMLLIYCGFIASYHILFIYCTYDIYVSCICQNFHCLFVPIESELILSFTFVDIKFENP